MDTMAERLRHARQEAGYKSARSAAMRFGWVISTYNAHENGQNEFDPETAEQYGRAFRVSAGWLLTGDGGKQRTDVPIMGRVGAGAEITPDYEHIPPEGLFTVDLPFPVPDDMIGFEIVGDSMLPKFDPGDVVVVWRDQRKDTENYVGKTAAVKIAEGPRFLKKIRRGPGKGLYNLESFNADLIEAVRLVWVGEIHVVVPADQIRRIERAERALVSRRRREREKATEGMGGLPLNNRRQESA